jgi:hypothetical protein
MTDRPVTPHSKTKPPGRRAIRCLLLTIVALTTACLIALVLVGGYVYRHPSSIKHLLAERISELTGVAVTVGELSYSVNPLHLGLRDVAARPAEDRPGFDLQLGSLVVDARLSGPFGRRTLVVEHLRAEDFSARLNTDIRLPKALAEAASPSSMGRLIRRLIRFFLISDIEWSLLEANNGRLTITGEAMQLVLDGFRLKSDAAAGIDARGRMVVSRIGADTHVAVADCRIRLEPAVRTETGSLSGRLELSGGRIYGTSFSADDIAAAVRLIYQSDRNEIALSEMSIDGRLHGSPDSDGRFASGAEVVLHRPGGLSVGRKGARPVRLVFRCRRPADGFRHGPAGYRTAFPVAARARRRPARCRSVRPLVQRRFRQTPVTLDGRRPDRP